MCMKDIMHRRSGKGEIEIKKLLALFLSVTMIFSIFVPVSASATSAKDTCVDGDCLYYSEEDANQAAKQAYESLSSEQKEEFLRQIELLVYQGDMRLAEYHTKYVDSTYKIEVDPNSVQVAVVTASIAGQLQALNLPTAVYYGLLAFATALGVPVGNVVDVVIGLGLAAIIVANWDAISGVWNEIVDIFVDAFGSAVMDAFYYLQGLVGVYTVSISGSTITINGEKYKCEEEAEAVVTTMKKNGHSYYPAYRSGGKILVCPVDIPRKAALAIMKQNSAYAGVFTISSSYARSLCQSLGGDVRHDVETGNGYWSHYHSSNYPKAHCWYIL